MEATSAALHFFPASEQLNRESRQGRTGGVPKRLLKKKQASPRTWLPTALRPSAFYFSGRGLLVLDAESFSDFVGVERVALHEAGDEARDFGAAGVNDFACALHLRVDDLGGGVPESDRNPLPLSDCSASPG